MAHENHWHDLDDARVVWWVHVDRDAENRWRDSLGQTDIDNWCAAYGWNANDVRSGSVIACGLSDGRTEVSADLVIRNEDGKPITHEGYPVTIPAVAPYTRPLPEGIAPVRRP